MSGVDANRAFEAIARELSELAQGVEAVGALLLQDTELALRHPVELQAFDRLSQHSAELAALMRRLTQGVDTDEALAALRLHELEQRIRLRMAS